MTSTRPDRLRATCERPLVAVVALMGLVGLLLVTGPPPAGAAPTAGGQEVVVAQEPIAGRYVVVLAEQGAADVRRTATTLADEHDGEVRRVYRHALQGFSVELTADEAEALAADPAVASVEEVGRITLDGRAQATPGAASAVPPWGLDRLDQADLPLDGRYEPGDGSAAGAGVLAYVIDSGLRASHRDFGGRVATGRSFVADQSTGDCLGHGTHVAGTIAGASYGVAKAVTVVPVRVFGCSGSTSTDVVIAAVDWVTGRHLEQPGPAVVNMSLGGRASPLVDAAVSNSIAAGLTYVVAAGNAGADACRTSPARLPAALTVGAVDDQDRFATFSNRGPCIDLSAPGVAIESAWYTSDAETRRLNGTSMASPHAAGVAARYLGTHPAADPHEVVAAVVDRAAQGRVLGAPGDTTARLLNTGFLLTGPSLTVVVEAEPESPRDFAFELCPPAPGDCAPVVLDDDDDPTAANWHGLAGVATGMHTITLDGPRGWDLDALTCDGEAQVDLAARSVQVDVTGTSHVTCTFEVASSALTVVTSAEPRVGQDVSYSVCPRPGPAPCRVLVLDDDDDPTRPARRSLTGLAAGRYRIVATTPFGWSNAAVVCDDGSPTDATRSRASVTVGRGEHVTCTFRVVTTSLTVVHQAEGAPDDVGYERCRVDRARCREVVLDDDAGDAARSHTRTFVALAPGRHAITPLLPDGWARRDLDCTEAVDVSGQVVTADLAPGEHVTCTFRLAPGAPPAHDAFAAARPIEGASGSVTASNVRATAEPGEPAHAGRPAGRSLWYRWTAPATGEVRFFTCGSPGSDFDTTLAVYTGSSLATLREEGSNDDDWAYCGDRSRVELPVVAGRTYHLAVDGHPGAVGTAVLHWTSR